MKRKEIALIKETRQSRFVEKIMSSISPHLNIKASDKIAIKILLSGSKEIYANTHYETVESLIFFLKDNFGSTDITVIEGSEGAYSNNKSTWDIFYKFRYKEVELNGAKLVNLDDLPHKNKHVIETFGGEREISYTTFDADYTIFVVPPKTHNIFPAVLSIPSIMGFIKPKDRAHIYSSCSTDQRRLNQLNGKKYEQLLQMSSRNIVSLYKKLPASLVFVDGLFGMEGKGPVKGSPVFHGFSIASEDAVSVDALTAFVMGFDKTQIPYIDMAEAEGIGNANWQNNIGVDPQTVKFPYRPHPIIHKFKGGGQRKNIAKNSKSNGKGGNDNNKKHKHGQKPFKNNNSYKMRNKNNERKANNPNKTT